MARIATLGSAIQDIYLIDHDDFQGSKVGNQAIFGQLTIGSKVDIDHLRYEVGGAGTNAAVTFARFGHETIYLGNIGHDVAGEAVRACLDQEGIDTSFLATIQSETACSIILLDSKSGQRTILTHRGASGNYDNLSADLMGDLAPDWLYVASLRGQMAKLAEFFQTAEQNQIKIMFNPGQLEIEQLPQLLDLLKSVDILLVNRQEAAQIVPGHELPELLENLAHLCPTVIITDGPRGAIATDHQAAWRLGLYESVKLRDPTGAGDAFGSGFLAHFAEHADFSAALKFAAANATSVIQKFGAKPGILRGDVELHSMPIQKL